MKPWTSKLQRSLALQQPSRWRLSRGRLSAVLAIKGRVVVMGMGKSGHVGRKIAATLASTGTAGHVRAPC